MNYNPYAPPQAPPLGAPTGAPYGQAQPWTASEAISLAWAAFKIHGGVLILSYLLSTFVAAVAAQLPGVLLLLGGASVASGTKIALQTTGALTGQVVSAFFQGGLIRIWLGVARGETPVFGTLFSGADRFLPLLVLNLLMMLAVGLGLVLLVVPGVILYLGLFASQFYVVDAGMGPVAAMKASWESTRGQKGEIFVLSLAGAGLGLIGVLMCCVGTVVTLPIFVLSTAIAFTRLSGRIASATPPGGPQLFASAPTSR